MKEEMGFNGSAKGGAAYPLYNLPRLEPENIFTIFDITDKQQDKIVIQHINLPDTMCFDDADPAETVVSPGLLSVCRAGKIITPYQTQQGIEFIDSRYLAPLVDINDLGLYQRFTTSGQTYFAAKAGMIIFAVIMPFAIITEEFIEQITSLASQSEIALHNKQAAEQINDLRNQSISILTDDQEDEDE